MLVALEDLIYETSIGQSRRRQQKSGWVAEWVSARWPLMTCSCVRKRRTPCVRKAVVAGGRERVPACSMKNRWRFDRRRKNSSKTDLWCTARLSGSNWNPFPRLFWLTNTAIRELTSSRIAVFVETGELRVLLQPRPLPVIGIFKNELIFRFMSFFFCLRSSDPGSTDP